MTVVDFWINLQAQESARRWGESAAHRAMLSELFKTSEMLTGYGVEQVLDDMGTAGVDLGIVGGEARLGTGLRTTNFGIHDVLGFCADHPDALRASLVLDSVERVRSATSLIAEVAAEPFLAIVRVIPMILAEPINSPRLYPVYERCESLGLPVSINVGVPGPRARAALQDPMLLDDVLLDFPDLTVVAAHMGHPWETLLVRLMRKYPRLHLSNSAYLAAYMDPVVLAFMNSSSGRDRLLFGSDAPLIGIGRAVDSARRLDISEEASAMFLGENAIRALGLRDPVAAGPATGRQP